MRAAARGFSGFQGILLALLLHGAIFVLVPRYNAYIPLALRQQAQEPNLPLEEFSGLRAMRHLEAIAAVGPRCVQRQELSLASIALESLRRKAVIRGYRYECLKGGKDF